MRRFAFLPPHLLGWSQAFRRSAILMLLLGSALLLLGAIIGKCPESSSSGDGASLSVYTLGALRGQAQVGPYSQYGWNHPGPMLFYTMSPLYYLSNYHELSHRITALLINIACLHGVVSLAKRYGDVSLSLLSGMGMVLIEWRAGGDLAFSAWNPHVTLLPLTLLMFVAAAIATGAASLLPLAVVLASFIAQSHLGFVPLALALSTGPVIVALLRGHRFSRKLWTAAILITAVVWLPPILQEFTNQPGNLSLITSFMLEEAKRPALDENLLRLFSTYYTLPFGNHMQLPVGRTAIISRSDWTTGFAVLLLVTLVLVTVLRSRKGETFQATLGAVCVGVSVVGFLSIYGVRREISDHHVFWLSIPGVLSVAAIFAAAVPVRSFDPGNARQGAFRLPVAAVILLLAMSLWRLVPWQQREASDRTTRTLYEALSAETDARGARAVTLAHTGASWAQAAGIVLQARKDGRHLSVTNDLLRVVDQRFRDSNEDIRFLVFDVEKDYKLLYDPSLPRIIRTDRYAIALVGPL